MTELNEAIVECDHALAKLRQKQFEISEEIEALQSFKGELQIELVAQCDQQNKDNNGGYNARDETRLPKSSTKNA